MNFEQIFNLAISYNASDIHLSSGCDITLRVNKELVRINNTLLLQKQIIDILHTLNPQLKICTINGLKQYPDCNFAYQFNTDYRIRVNVFCHNNGVACACRVINNNIKSLNEVDMPIFFHNIARYHNGLVIITGKTGSGKSTTISHILQTINQTQKKHIITLEDPIEFVYTNQLSLIHQREINIHTTGLQTALVESLRQDPDIIMIGELREKDNIKYALSAADTGHLVISTMHSNSTIDAISRIINTSDDKDSTRHVLAHTLKAIVAQRLSRTASGKIQASYEVLISNQAIQNLILENKIQQIKHFLQSGREQGMMSFN